MFRKALVWLVAFGSMVGLTAAQPGGAVTGGPSTTAATASSQNSPTTPEEAYKRLKKTAALLKDKASRDPSGHIRLMARLSAASVRPNQNTAPERFARGAFDKASLATPLALIEVAQNRVLARMKSAGAPYLKAVRHLPMVVLVVKAAQIDALVSAGDVMGLYEDRLAAPDLANSTRKVGAQQASIMGARGKGTTIAVIDSGVLKHHPFFQDRVLDGACFSTRLVLSVLNVQVNIIPTCPGGEEVSTATTAGTPCTLPACFHGTAVAGIAAGRDNSGFPHGVAPEANILPIQTNSIIEQFPGMNCSHEDPCVGSYESDVTAALQFVRENATRLNIVASVISLGDDSEHSSSCDDRPVAEMIEALFDMEVATVVSAGNFGHDHGVGGYGCVSKAVTVGATDLGDKMAVFPSPDVATNHGELVDILAPGVNIRTSMLDPSFNGFNGTSASAPHVAGAVALLRGRFPDGKVQSLLGLMQGTGAKVEDPRNNPERMRLDVCAAFRLLLPEAQFSTWANYQNVKVVVGDFDSDGKVDDIAMTGGVGWGMIAVAFRQPNGTFTLTMQFVADFSSWAQQPSAKLVSGDFDGDGASDDIAMTGGLGWSTIPVAYGQPGGNFTVSNQPVAGFPLWAQEAGTKVVAGDFDGDGKVDDIALVGSSEGDTLSTAFAPGGPVGGTSTSIALALGQPGGNFTVKKENAGAFGRFARQPNVQAVAGDFDGDRRLDDIALAQGSGWTTVPVALHQNAGSFSFTNQQIEGVPEFFNANQRPEDRVAMVDFDGDRRLDDLVVIGKSRPKFEVFVGAGGGKFRYFTTEYKGDFRGGSDGSFAQAPGVHILSGNFDGDNLRDDLALVGGANWCHIPVYLGSASGDAVVNPSGGQLEP